MTATATAVAARRRAPQRLRLSVAMGVWALGYAVYRGYYAAGGTWALPGTIRAGSEDRFQAINLVAAVLIAAAAVLPFATLRLWSRPRARQALLALCWVVAVGCTMHALIDMTQRVLSLAGLVDVRYPDMWASVDRRDADLQDLLGNEPWFLVEGVAYGALGWLGLRAGRARARWLGTAVAATAVLTAMGVLSVVGVMGRAIVG